MKRSLAILLTAVLLSNTALPAYAAEEPLVSAALEGSSEASTENSAVGAGEASTAAAGEASTAAPDNSGASSAGTSAEPSESAGEGSGNSSSESSKESSTESATGASTEDAPESSSEASSEDSSSEASSEASSESSSDENYDDYPTGYDDFGYEIEYESVSNGRRSNGLFRSDNLESYYVNTTLPDLRDQSPYGTCWAFATTAVAEINLAKKGYNMDLSELHMAYFANHFVDDPLGGFGECEQPAVPNDYLGRGGNYYTSFPTYVRWNGAASEQTANYADDTVYAAKYGLSDDIAYEKAAHIVNYYAEPIPTDRTDFDAIKKLIKAYGSVAVSIRVHSGTAASTGSEYNAEHNCFNHTSNGGAGHAVTLVGWDDKFSRDNFDQKPKGDGAFLVRNSWTTGNFADNQSFAGYFWMSYYDVTINGNAYAAEFEPGPSYDNNYQYCQIPTFVGGYVYDKLANVFTAHAEGGYYGEIVKAVSFNSTASNLQMNISVYTGLTDETKPESGTLQSSQDFSTTYAGYYTVPLATPVNVAQGETFSVVITNKSGDGKYLRILYETDFKFGSDDYKPETSGKSYYAYTSSYENQEKWSVCDDIAINAFTDNNPYSGEIPVPPETISFTGIGEEGLTIDASEKKKVTAIVLPENATNMELEWESSNESIATVQNGIITGIAPGTVTITARAVLGDASNSFTLKVNDRLRAFSVIYGVSRSPMTSGDQISISYRYSPKNYVPKNDPIITTEPEGALVPGTYSDHYLLTTPGYMTVNVEVDGITSSRRDYVFPGASYFDYEVDDDNIITFTWKALEEATSFRFYTSDNVVDKTVIPDGSEEYTLVIDEYKDDPTFKKKDFRVRTDAAGKYQDIAIYDVGNLDKPCTVHFDSKGGSSVEDVDSDYRRLIAEPANPEKYGYIFAGWYKDKDCTAGNTYDFDKKIKENYTGYKNSFTLYAKWERNPEDTMIEGLSIVAQDVPDEIKVGETFELGVELTPADTTLPRVTWSSSNDRVAVVDETGKVTGTGAGNATITVTADADDSISDSYDVFVWSEATGKPAKEIRILDTAKTPHFLGSSSRVPSTTLYGDVDDIYGVNIELPVFDDPYGDEEFSGLQLAVGKSCNLKADFLPKDSIPKKSGKTYIYADVVKAKDVTWSSYNSGVATVDSKGKVTAKGAGITTIRMASESSGLSATCKVMVYDAVTGLTLNTTNLKLGKGQEFELIPKISPATASNKVTFVSSNTNVAAVDRYTGEITAGEATGKAVITVTAQGGKTAKCNVNVGNAVETLRLYEKKNIDNVAAGKTLQLVTEYNGGVRTNQPLNKDISYWIVDGDDLVTSNAVASITQKGVLKGLSEGKVTVKVMSKTDKDGADYVSSTYDVYVYSGLKSATLNQKNLTMVPGGEYTLRASVKSFTNADYVTGSFDRDTDEFEAWNAAGRIVWTVVPEGALELADNGEVCTITATEALKTAATVKATFRPCGATRDTVLSCKVTVKDGAVTGLAPKPTSVSISRGQITVLTANITPMAPAYAGLTWTIDEAYENEICFVDEDGDEIGLTTTSDGRDEAGNTVRIKALSGDATKSVKAVVKVTTDAEDKNGKQISKNIAVTVLSEGKEVVIQGGGVTSYGTDPDNVSITPLCAKKSASLKAIVYVDRATNVKAGNQKVTWAVTENPQVASVNASGKVIGLSNGVATIAATSASGKTSYVKIGVYSDVTKLTLDKTKISMSTEYSGSESTSSGAHYEALTASITPEDLFGNDMTYSKYANKVTWTVSGAGAVELAAVNASALSGSTLGKRIDAKQSVLKELTYAAPANFAGTGPGEVLAIKAVGAGTVKLTAQAGSRKATCTVTIYSHVTGIELSVTNVYMRTRSRIPLSPRLEIDKVPMPVKPIAPKKPNIFDPDYQQKWEAYQIALAEYYTKLAQYNAALPGYNALKKMAVNTTVYYKSSDESVATVDSKGNVTAKGPGTAKITATTAEGNHEASALITVE